MITVEFLHWLRDATETAWRSAQELTVADYERAGVGGTSWRKNTRWSGGLNDEQIDAIQNRYEQQFPTDYRVFLRTLHSTTPRMSGASFAGGSTLRPIERPGFYDWLRDEEAIREMLAWPLEGILFDVEHNALWPTSWGPRPADADGRRARVAALVANGPKLIPVFGHRFLVATEPHVVLSVYQADIIVYGDSLETYLLNELGDLMGTSAPEAFATEPVDHTRIPFWGELIG